jgi:bifunctional DNA-binding transcriptional regulator/antitoxin component of YhaV-PrlF toxin-antitoxin module
MAMRESGLIKGFAQVDSGGKIALPRNILVAMDLGENDTVELKITGANKSRKMVVSKRQNHR